MFVGRKDDPDGNEETTHARAGGAQANPGGSYAGRGQGGCRRVPRAAGLRATYYRWRNQFGGLKADDVKRLKDLERENATLKRLLAEAELEKAALKEIAQGNF